VRQVTPFLKGAQQLDGEQGMAACVPGEPVAKTLWQAIGLTVQQGIDKAPAIGLVEVDPDLAPQPAELVQDRLKRVPFAFRLLPRVWLAVVLHLADDEFPANANILFDATVSHYLPTEDLAVLGGMLAGRLSKAAPRQAP
jgi:hypothetical protein